MRLTLRTLLAYLDDTLEPLEIKTIGQKVAENPTAQDLIARIKQVTRRRRITTPPATGPNAFDPNLVAEYLDERSILTPEQVAEVEKICLESDVHLAEVASCHQILTLVLGEPAVVPPTAKERMYGLVRGREAIPFRKVAAARGEAVSPSSADADADEMYLLGLPFYRRGSWLRWALPAAAVLLFIVVAVALWQSIQPAGPVPVAQKSKDRGNAGAADNSTKAPNQPEAKGTNGEDKERGKEGGKQPPTVTNPPNNPPNEKQTNEGNTGGSQAQIKTNTPPPTAQPEQTPDKQPAVAASGRLAPPNTERVAVGQYYISDHPPGHSLLVQRKDGKGGWSRLGPSARVTTGDELVSLPGYASEIRLDCGIYLLLRGHLKEFTPQLLAKDETGREVNQAGVMDYLQESAIVLHKPKKDTNADLTLERGRVYFSHHKPNDPSPLVVRLRFENKVWDLTLFPGAEAVADLIKLRPTGEPLAILKLTLLQGNAGLALEGEKYPDLTAPGWAWFGWDSANPSAFDRQQLSKEDLEDLNRTIFPKKPSLSTDQAQKMDLALKALKDRMIVGKDPLTVLQEVLSLTEKFFEHQLALYCLTAMDEVKELFNVLDRADQIHSQDRSTAILAVRHWLDHDHGQDRKLFDPQSQNGLLVSALGYAPNQANRIMELLRDPTFEEVFNSKEYYEYLAKDLTSEKVAIAELAWWRLRLLSQFFKLKLPKLDPKAFNAARPAAERRAAMQEVLDQISAGRLPPPDPNKAAPAGAKGGNATKSPK